MQLAQSLLPHANIASTLSALTLTYSAEPKVAVARVDLSGIAGNGQYTASVWVNGGEILPEFPIDVGPAVTAATAQSKMFALQTSDTVIIKVLGLPADTDVVLDTYITEVGVDQAGVAEALATFFPRGQIVSTANAVSALQTAINNWAAALATDALNPGMTYSVDGESYQRNEWRDKLLENMLRAQTIINKFQPWTLRTRLAV